MRCGRRFDNHGAADSNASEPRSGHHCNYRWRNRFRALRSRYPSDYQEGLREQGRIAAVLR